MAAPVDLAAMNALYKAIREQHPTVTASRPLYKQRLMCHVGDRLPDVRRAKLLSPSVHATPASQQTSAQAAGVPATRQSAGGSSAAGQASAAHAEQAPSARSDPGPSPPPPDPAATPADASDSTDADSGTAAQSQQTQTNPEEIYGILPTWSQDMLLVVLDGQIMRGFNALCWRHGAWTIPGFPRTASAAAELQAQIDQLVAQAEDLRAFPWLCQMAMYSAYALGPTHSETVHAVYRVIQSMHQRLEYDTDLHLWLLGHATRQWGLSHPDTRRLVEQAADILARVPDPWQCTALARSTANIAKHLPQGLGWGTCSLEPLDHQDAYHRHAVMQARAQALLDKAISSYDLTGRGVESKFDFLQKLVKADRQLAKQMLERCITFYESIGHIA